MANKKYTPRQKATSAHKEEPKKKNQNASYIAILVSLVVALTIVVGAGLGILIYNLPDNTPADSEQSSSSSIWENDDGWSKNY